MSNRVLIIISGVLAVFAIYLYLNKDNVSTDNDFDARFDYSASHIHAINTNQQGDVILSVSASKLAHELSTGIFMLENIHAEQVLNGQGSKVDKLKKINFQADNAQWQRKKNQILLKDNVSITRQIHQPNSALDKKNLLIAHFKGQNIHYNTKTQQLHTKAPIQFNAGKSYIKADALNADLKTGDYVFKQIHASYQK